jgi:lipoyl(octanoyl) transferase
MDARFFYPYARAAARQRELVAARIAGAVPDLLLLVEHEPVVTLGSSSREEHLLLDREEYRRRGIAVTATDRGGDVTYHGPGQLVAYPIIRLDPGERDLHGYLRAVEEAGLRALAAFGVEAFRAEGRTGLWTERGKVAAIGVHVRTWVTFHGMALNVDVDLAAFETIVPCGLDDRRVTSMAQVLAPRPPPAFDAVAAAPHAAFEQVFARPLAVARGADCERLTPEAGA